MDCIALVTGSKANVKPLAYALERVGFSVSRATAPEDAASLAAHLAAGSVSCYVQAPFESEVKGANAIERARQFLAGGVLARFQAAAAVLPLLRPDACVILVGDDGPPPEGTPDDPRVRDDLLRMLTRAIAGSSPGGDRKSLLVSADRSPEEVAHMAVNRGEDRQWLHSRVRAIPPNLTYDDWRLEVIGLTDTPLPGG